MNRYQAISNGTIFGIWPLSRSIPTIALLLVALFVAMKPEASLGLGFFERVAFWVVHVGVGLSGLLVASWLLLPKVMEKFPVWLALLLTGLAGASVVVPVLFAVEFVLPAGLQAVEDSWLDRYAKEGLWQGLAAEYIQAAPEILFTWVAINLPLLVSQPQLNDPPHPMGGPDGVDSNPSDEDLARQKALEERQAFLDSLPKAIGTDILAISSDLHYLHVHTALGRCMTLGSLQRVTKVFDDEDGFRVHRAHWVARHAVVKLIKDGKQWYCLLTNGLRIPISRRNKSHVTEWFGQNANVVPLPARQHRSSTR